ncbi:hypothetical protein PM082_016869 [Marasmius tenuissimus]|nr:hypothetical protein PM082_016869 [Marasmius tenuissimus]
MAGPLRQRERQATDPVSVVQYSPIIEGPVSLMGVIGEGPNALSDSFKVEWLCTERLSFLRTSHIRNPWNHNKEIKVSRDGTEIEPVVGQQLLDEWNKFVQEVRGGVVTSSRLREMEQS